MNLTTNTLQKIIFSGSVALFAATCSSSPGKDVNHHDEDRQKLQHTPDQVLLYAYPGNSSFFALVAGFELSKVKQAGDVASKNTEVSISYIASNNQTVTETFSTATGGIRRQKNVLASGGMAADFVYTTIVIPAEKIKKITGDKHFKRWADKPCKVDSVEGDFLDINVTTAALGEEELPFRKPPPKGVTATLAEDEKTKKKTLVIRLNGVEESGYGAPPPSQKIYVRLFAKAAENQQKTYAAFFVNKDNNGGYDTAFLYEVKLGTPGMPASDTFNNRTAYGTVLGVSIQKDNE